jgi:hypothetical protein
MDIKELIVGTFEDYWNRFDRALEGRVFHPPPRSCIFQSLSAYFGGVRLRPTNANSKGVSNHIYIDFKGFILSSVSRKANLVRYS